MSKPPYLKELEKETCSLCGHDERPVFSMMGIDDRLTYVCGPCLNCCVEDALRWAKRGAVRKSVTVVIQRDMTVDVQKGD